MEVGKVKIGGVELGGMSCTVGVAYADAPEVVVEKVNFETTTPEETLGRARGWLAERGPLAWVGVASFGPLDLGKGEIAATPKPGWRGARVAALLQEGMAWQVALDTDVNAPAMAEAAAIIKQQQEQQGDVKEGGLCYVTVGTGVGVGAAMWPATTATTTTTRLFAVHGHSHPEAGHVPCFLHEEDVAGGYEGHCPFHGARCIEGVLRASALAARAALPHPRLLASLGDEHPVWPLAAFYAAQLCLSLSLTLCPTRIVLGGGPFASRPHLLLPLLRSAFAALLNGYVSNPSLDDLSSYLVPSRYGPDAGIVGALYLASINLNK